ncbi:MAG TPA: ketopantoate reductase C-terminal domain-containing protein, partial [Acidimicrobiales bacterium]|nr:ketopantoate reductase C-terminal domain-containing protein [Acidimicrobiales bacterium]
SEARADIARWKWGKLLLNLTNAVEAVCGSLSRGGELSKRVRREGVECLEAAGIEFVGNEEDRARRGDLLKVLPAKGTERGGGSSWQSLARGAGSIESDYLNGEIVLLGRLHGFPTPLNATLQRLASEGARDLRSPGWMSESEVLAAAGRLAEKQRPSL